MTMADEIQGAMATNDPAAGSNAPQNPAEPAPFDIEMNPHLPGTPTLSGASSAPTVPAGSAVPVHQNQVPIPTAAPTPIQPLSSGALSALSPEPRLDETEFERTERLKLDTSVAPHSGAINDDIATILKSAGLPERHDFKATADQKPAPAAPIPVPDIDKALKQAETVAPPAPEERPIVVASHTLKDDLQDIVRRKKISLVKAAALEQDKKRPEPIMPLEADEGHNRKRRTVSIIFVSILLVCVGGAALYGVMLTQQASAPAASSANASLIFAEQSETVAIDNTSPAALKTAITQALGTSIGAVGSITQIVPTVSTTSADGTQNTGLATLPTFLAALGISPPAQLMQGLGSSFFFGTHNVGTNAPLFVIPVTNYDLAFAGMLAWEPQMDQDLAPIFTSVPALVTGSNGLPTARTFQDAVMRNYDVRELKDDSGNVVLYYSFPTPNLLIIAQDPSTFTELLSRLQARSSI